MQHLNEILSRNNVKIIGKGDKTLVLAHGFGCDQNVWKEVTPYFEKDYKIILFDHVGTGKSDINAYAPAKYEDLKDYAISHLDDIICIIDKKPDFFRKIGLYKSNVISTLGQLRTNTVLTIHQ